jgi:hypothetical protein
MYPLLLHCISKKKCSREASSKIMCNETFDESNGDWKDIRFVNLKEQIQS